MPDGSVLRVGIIGCGQVTEKWHVPAYLRVPEKIEVVAVCDPTPAARERVQTLLGLPDDCVYESFESVIARSDVDIIDLCTPPQIRLPIVTAAAAAGKHIISEKPMASTPEIAAAIVRAARDAGVRLGIVHNFLHFPHISEIMDHVEAGAIGVIDVAMVTKLGYDDSSNDVLVQEIERVGGQAYEPGWRHRAAIAGGGVLMDLLHCVYVGERLLGKPIERVSGWTAASPGADTEEIALCRFETETNAALVSIGYGVGPNRIDLTGSEGNIACTVITEVGPGTLFVSNADGTVTSDHNFDDEVMIEAIGAVLRDFADAVNEGRDPETPGEQGQHILEAVFGTYESAATGRTVRLPMDSTSPVYKQGVVGLGELESSSDPLAHARRRLVRAGQPAAR